MTDALSSGFSPGVAVLAFIGLIIGGIVALIAILKAISVIGDASSDARIRRHRARRPRGSLAMGPGEGFSDWCPEARGNRDLGLLDRAAGHNESCRRDAYEPGSFTDRALGHDADRCYDRDSISGQDWDYGRYN